MPGTVTRTMSGGIARVPPEAGTSQASMPLYRKNRNRLKEKQESYAAGIRARDGSAISPPEKAP